MSYGAVGTSPLSDFSDTIEHMIANLLYTNYDQTITGVPITDLKWEQWNVGIGDYVFYFMDLGDFDMGYDMDWSHEFIDHYVDIHIWVRALHQDYPNIAEKQLFKFVNWIKKTLRQHKEDLKSQGILYIEYMHSRQLLPSDAIEDWKRVVISLRCNYIMISN